MTDESDRLARIEERLSAIERLVSAENSAGAARGTEQHRHGERIAVLETDQKHLLTTLTALKLRIDGLLASVLLAGLAWFLAQVGAA